MAGYYSSTSGDYRTKLDDYKTSGSQYCINQFVLQKQHLE